jgi:transcriptional regulator with XRE-family HTH domain
MSTGVEKMPVSAVISLSETQMAGSNGHQMVPRTLGQVFRDYRQSKGRAWTQGFVAKRAGLHVSSVVKVERDRPEVTAETKERVAAALGVPLAALKAEVATPSPHVGNSTVDLPIRTRHTTDTPLGHSVVTRGEIEEKADMYNADRVATIAAVLTMNPRQISDIRRHIEIMLLRDQMDASPGKARG